MANTFSRYQRIKCRQSNLRMNGMDGNFDVNIIGLHAQFIYDLNAKRKARVAQG